MYKYVRTQSQNTLIIKVIALEYRQIFCRSPWIYRIPPPPRARAQFPMPHY